MEPTQLIALDVTTKTLPTTVAAAINAAAIAAAVVAADGEKEDKIDDGNKAGPTSQPAATAVAALSSAPAAAVAAVAAAAVAEGPISLVSEPGSATSISSPLQLVTKKQKDKSHRRKRPASCDLFAGINVSADNASSSAADAGSDYKDDDDDNDDDDDKLSMQEYDPERLKAFNMFVRLFVDENLDRVAPISKQPKEKIQAILEACDRQFPEFHHRSRKRIRTYLKSCRRMRRSKGAADNGKQIRPTLPHLTSAAAETILTRACENESNNAKRMRMGLEPLPANEMANAATSSHPLATNPTKSSPRPKISPQQTAAIGTTPTPNKPFELTSLIPTSAGSSNSPSLGHAQLKLSDPTVRGLPIQTSPKAAHRPIDGDHMMLQGATMRAAISESDLPIQAAQFTINGGSTNGRTFPDHHNTVLNDQYHEMIQNGPTDLSMKKEITPTSLSTSIIRNHLSPEEVATIKQLIAGYRESAAFLCRSADELQQLIAQQN